MTQAIFVGLAGLDIVYLQETLPPENFKGKTNQFEAFIGGPAANAAITYALLGGKAALVACIGDSPAGVMLKQTLANTFGVRVIDCAAGAQALPCISSISVNAATGARTIWSGQRLFPLEGMEEALADIQETMAMSACALFDSNAPEIALTLLRMAHGMGKDIVFDMGSWKPDMALFLSMATEAIASAACVPPAGSGYGSFAEAALGHGIARFAITDGERPIFWRADGQEGEITPPAAKAVDTLGAGDIYHGAYCYFRYHAGLGFREALASAAVVAASSVAHFGPRAGVRAYTSTN